VEYVASWQAVERSDAQPGGAGHRADQAASLGLGLYYAVLFERTKSLLGPACFAISRRT
jgi:hypothetical protein